MQLTGNEEHHALKLIAKAWGWSRLERCTHLVGDDAPPDLRGFLIIWYESGHPKDILFQINRMPTYRVAVYALRYGICSGWYSLDLSQSLVKWEQEVNRLSPFVARKWFSSPRMRRQFRVRQPECANYSWEKIQQRGTPYTL